MFEKGLQGEEMFARKYKTFYCWCRATTLASPGQFNSLTRCFDAFDEGLHVLVTFGLLVNAPASRGPSPAVCRVRCLSEVLVLGSKEILQGFYC